LNAVIALESPLSPRALLDALLAVEQEFGRDRAASIANGPRTLDLDILLFEDLEISQADLKIPHPRLAERAFVLIPLNEIAPQVIVPGLGETVARMLARLFNHSKSEPDAVVRVISQGWPSR
jgi:2-amino-4-hydroxy-6-hydroxymethyldihydropteridine diphosphokinase